jgi:mannose-6-phosphate isomerase-like protein (cupin superfamily)
MYDELMKIFAPQNSAHVIGEHSGSIFHEYDLPFQKFSVGVSEIEGTYPPTGFDVDTQVEAVWYVLSGTGRVSVAGKIYDLKTGDMILLPVGEKFWIEGHQLKLVVTSSPPWTPEQHQHIEEEQS